MGEHVTRRRSVRGRFCWRLKAAFLFYFHRLFLAFPLNHSCIITISHSKCPCLPFRPRPIPMSPLHTRLPCQSGRGPSRSSRQTRSSTVLTSNREFKKLASRFVFVETRNTMSFHRNPSF